jgi:hypothetical protein
LNCEGGIEHNSLMPFFFLFCLILTNSSLGSAQVDPAVPPPAKPAAPSAPAPATKASDVKTPIVKMTSVTKVVGEAGPRVVTSREVRINEAISQVLLGPVGDGEARVRPAKSKVLAVDDPTFPAQVLKVLDEWTVYLEATEIGSKSADKAEVNRLVKVVTETWKGAQDWEKLEASIGEIRDVIDRKLAAQSLERLKGDASLVNVSDAEALQYYKKNRLRFGNLPFENFKDNIKAALIRTQTERRLIEWRAVLRRKYRVRTFVGA